MRLPALPIARRASASAPPWLLGLLLAVGTALTVGCSDNDKASVTDPDPPTTGTIMIAIDHMVGGGELVFDSIEFMNAAGNEFSVTRLEYYLSDFYVMGPDGRYDLDAAFYVNGRDESTLMIVIEDVPPLHYNTLGFTFGLDEEDNVTGKYDSNNDLGMVWPETWGGGYHYMKLEGRFLDAEQVEKGYLTHMGRFHNVDMGRLNEHHFVDETFDLHQNVVAGETLMLGIEVDLKEWYDHPNTLDLELHSSGIMMDFERQTELEQNCASVFTLHGAGTHEGRP